MLSHVGENTSVYMYPGADGIELVSRPLKAGRIAPAERRRRMRWQQTGMTLEMGRKAGFGNLYTPAKQDEYAQRHDRRVAKAAQLSVQVRDRYADNELVAERFRAALRASL